MASRTAFQSHTYAGSSARALANGAALLNELDSWRPSVRAIEAEIAPIIAELNKVSVAVVGVAMVSVAMVGVAKVSVAHGRCSYGKYSR